MRGEPRYRRRTLRPGRTSGRPRRFRWLGRPGRPRRAPVRERPGLLPRARLQLLVEKRKVAFVAQVRSLRQTPISEDVAVPAGVVSAAVAPGAVALTSRGRAVVPRLGDVQAERVRSRGARPLFGYCWLWRYESWWCLLRGGLLPFLRVPEQVQPERVGDRAPERRRGEHAALTTAHIHELGLFLHHHLLLLCLVVVTGEEGSWVESETVVLGVVVQGRLQRAGRESPG